MKRVSPQVLSVVAVVGFLLGGSNAVAVEKRLEAVFGAEGLQALRWAGADLLENGAPRISRIILEKKWLGGDGLNQYDFETADATEPKVSFDQENRVLGYDYPWGFVSFAYGAKSDRLELTTTIRNTSDRTIAMFDITPFSLSLPQAVDRPKGWRGSVDLPGDFNVVEAVYGGQKLLLCCETVMPLHFGFGNPREKDKVLPVMLRGNVNITEPGGVVYHHYGLPRIEAGKALVIKMSLRFVAAEADGDEPIADMIETFQNYHTPPMVWEDRRPIGTIFLGNGRGPENNPRFWFRDAELDVRTEAGRAKLRERMLEHADRCIGVLKGMNAQGMVVWDPEGSENPHPTTYIGDPRMVKLVAPEMEDIYPEYFKRFLDAGLRTGCCIRPTQVYMTPFTAACDGDVNSRWSVQDFPQWLEVDFGSDKMIDKTEVVCLNDRAYQFTIEAKPDGGEYSRVIDRTKNTTPGSAEAPITDTFRPLKARYVKLTVTGAHEYDGDWSSIREFRVYGGEGKNLCLNKASDCSRRFGRTVGGHGPGCYEPDRNPLGDDFSDIWPKGVPAERFYPIVERMCRKIEFAKKHWGCTLIYVDTNGIHRPVGEAQELKWTLLDPHIWREIHQRHPDVLLIPEFAPNPGQLAYTTSYLQPPYSPPVTRPFWRELLPGAFSVSQTVNLKPEDWEELRPRFLEGVTAGDSFFFRGWFGCSYNKKIKALTEPTDDKELDAQTELHLKRDAVHYWINQKKE